MRVRLLAAALSAAIIAGPAADAPPALAGACPGANAAPEHATRHELMRATLCLINAERRSRSLRPLHPVPRLSQAALGHSRDMVRRRYFSHTTSEGAAFLDRIRAAGYLGRARNWVAGENLAWGATYTVDFGVKHREPTRRPATNRREN
jgi:uncharacterized protein YkwD